MSKTASRRRKTRVAGGPTSVAAGLKTAAANPTDPRLGRLSAGVLTAAITIVVVLVVAGCGAAGAATNTSDSSGGAAPDPASVLAATGKPKIVDFGSTSCLPCRMMQPELEELAQEYAGAVDVVIVDVNKEPELAAKLGIRVVPTQIFLSPEGKVLGRHEGFLSKEQMVTALEQLGYPVLPAGVTPVPDDAQTSQQSPPTTGK
ncbi:MAG: thioredoxin family protein [Thermoleophilia bacterium]|nr:thioredoxin family protein [Thermoleophilia bacterium]